MSEELFYDKFDLVDILEKQLGNKSIKMHWLLETIYENDDTSVELYVGWDITHILANTKQTNLYKALECISGKKYRHNIYACEWTKDSRNMPSINIYARLNEDGKSWSMLKGVGCVTDFTQEEFDLLKEVL